MASSSSSSNSGFQHGFLYKIVSVKDRYAITVENGSLEAGAKVIVQKIDKKLPSQKFRTEQVPFGADSGNYLVSPLSQPGDGKKLVWDWDRDEGLVMNNYYIESENPVQIWTTERVPRGSSKVCFIKSADGNCLKNMGKGKQLALVPKDARDPYQHWRLDPTQ